MSFTLDTGDVFLTWDDGQVEGFPVEAVLDARWALLDAPVEIGSTPTGPFFAPESAEGALLVLRRLWPNSEVGGDPPVFEQQPDELDRREPLREAFEERRHWRDRLGRWRDMPDLPRFGRGEKPDFETHEWFHVTTRSRAKLAREQGLKPRAALDPEGLTFGTVGVDEQAVYLWPTRQQADEWRRYLEGRGIAKADDLETLRVYGIEPSRLSPDHETFGGLVLHLYLRERLSPGHQWKDFQLPSGEMESEYGALLDSVGFWEEGHVGGPEWVTLRQWLDRRPDMAYRSEKDPQGAFWRATSPSAVSPEWAPPVRDPWRPAIKALHEMPRFLRVRLADEFSMRGRPVSYAGAIPPDNLVEAEELVEAKFVERLHWRDRKGRFRDMPGMPDFDWRAPREERQAVAARREALRAEVIPPSKPGHIRLYVGTSTLGMEAAREQGFFGLRDHRALANAIEDEYGLERDSVWNHSRFEYVRASRARDPNVYATPDYENATYYANTLNESTVDALKAAHRILNDDLMREIDALPTDEQHGRWKASEDAFIEAWKAKHGEARPVIAVLDVPVEKIEVPEHVRDRFPTSQEWIDAATDDGKLPLPHEITFRDRLDLGYVVGEVQAERGEKLDTGEPPDRRMMFHLAPREARDAVEAGGINFEVGQQPGMTEPGNYLWGSLADALAYKRFWGGREMDVYVVDARELDLRPDPLVPEGAWVTPDLIPRERLRRAEPSEYEKPDPGGRSARSRGRTRKQEIASALSQLRNPNLSREDRWRYSMQVKRLEAEGRGETFVEPPPPWEKADYGDDELAPLLMRSVHRLRGDPELMAAAEKLARGEQGEGEDFELARKLMKLARDEVDPPPLRGESLYRGDTWKKRGNPKVGDVIEVPLWSASLSERVGMHFGENAKLREGGREVLYTLFDTGGIAVNWHMDTPFADEDEWLVSGKFRVVSSETTTKREGTWGPERRVLSVWLERIRE